LRLIVPGLFDLIIFLHAGTLAVPARPAAMVAVIVVAVSITTLVAGRPSSSSFGRCVMGSKQAIT
jgi:hypothetical protein